MIDIHSHILPGIDDGASDTGESIKLARKACELGLEAIVATPHYRNDQPNPEKVKENLMQLKNLLVEEGLELELMPGEEITICHDLAKKARDGKVLGLNNSRYLLIEFPFNRIPRFSEGVFYDLKVLGYFPIIAHPARYNFVNKDIGSFYEMVSETGIYAQLDAASLTGRFGRDIKKTAIKLVENDLVHFIASDSHSSLSLLDSYVEALDMLERFNGNKKERFLENARQVIADKELDVPEPRRPKKGMLGSFKSIFR